MKILLIWPPWYRLQKSEFAGYPIGITSIATVLEEKGYEARVYHADYTGTGTALHTSELTQVYDAYKKRLKDADDPIWSEVRDTVIKFEPDIVGISVMTGSYGSAMMCAKIVKTFARDVGKNIPVVMGGAHPTVETESTLMNDDVDFIVIGEGEETFLELVEAIEKHGDFSKIRGIAYKNKGKIIINEKRPLIKDLDLIPFPSRHLILNSECFDPDVFGGVFSSRGCPFNCIFCSSKTIWGQKTRFRSVDKVIGEIRNVIEEYGTRHFFFVDDSFSLRKDRIIEMCKRLGELRKEHNFTWHCQTRVDLLDEEIVTAMKGSGCNCVLIGVETGYTEGLKKIKKAITLEQVMHATGLLKKHGITTNAFFMIGFPWETINEINSTIDFMRKMDPDDASYAIVTPQPGTELFDIVKGEGLLPSSFDWSEFQHQSKDMFFTNKFNRGEKERVIEMAEAAFDRQKHKKLREQAMKNPFSVIRRFIQGGYYKRPTEFLRLGYKVFFSRK